jgi:ABC-type uncharacterized transport system permease subunit
MKKLLITVAASIAVLICASLASAQDGLTLTLTSGTHTTTLTDAGSGIISTNNLTIGNWSPLDVLVTSQPYVGDSTDDYVSLAVTFTENLTSAATHLI